MCAVLSKYFMASLRSFERLIPMKLDHSYEAIGPNHSGLRRDRTYFDAIADFS